VQINNAVIAGRLIDHGADVNARVGEELGGGTSLHIAASNGYDECAKLLLEHRADIGATNSSGLCILNFLFKYSIFNQ
jgi:ankyrin repeat protein